MSNSTNPPAGDAVPSPGVPPILARQRPVPDNQLDAAGNEAYKALFSLLQGNILKGHGRDFSANIFVEFSASAEVVADWLQAEALGITSAATQLKESIQFKKFGIPGALFKNIYLTAHLYRYLDIAGIDTAFADPGTPGVPVLPQEANFLGGMKVAAPDLSDDLPAIEARQDNGSAEPLEQAYLEDRIHALILLADDDEGYLQRVTREFITLFEAGNGVNGPLGTVLAVELGKALRNDEDEGIEHFGYVDGRSQPLFLASDFKPLVLTDDGGIDVHKSREKINEKAKKKERGDIHIWNPFASLDLVLLPDSLAGDANAFGSYFVFRKLEQDVLRFTMEEQNLADSLGLIGQDRERAGAMAVGRFRDGTPLVLQSSDGMVPAKANNFRYDGLDAHLQPATAPGAASDEDGLRCPFHAHIRKTNPRQSTAPFTGPGPEEEQEKEDRKRRITRRGIPYGSREKAPDTFQALDDLPTGGVGLLFGCFQSSISHQFSFMQKTWVNNTGFKRAEVGEDPLIGQRADPDANPAQPQHWRAAYGEEEVMPDVEFPGTHPVAFAFSDFIKFRGGEFFFAPSLAFFRKLPGLLP